MYDQIIGIIGAPRSGTSWTGQIFDSSPSVLYRMQPFYSWAFRDKLHVRSEAGEIQTFFDQLYASDDPYLWQKERKEKGIYPVFSQKEDAPSVMVFKEVMFHYMMPVILENMSCLKLIAVLRHPVDVLTSYYNAPREFDPALDIQEEWYFAQSRNQLLPERYFGYHKWKEFMMIVAELQKRFGDRVKIVRYEDLKKEPEKLVREQFDFAGISYTEQTDRFLYQSQHSTNEDPYSVFRNINDKKTGKELPKNIIDAIHKDLASFPFAARYDYQ